ncbi:hypothetical protein [Sulfurimonas sp.]|uniref:hypothetical protein n=1 Tax=Sulfurimonas sp. TaxID=2022749 RepID=UPI0025E7976E|nr:hypothetical protein [Sulfurimonas sp.]
MALDSDTLATDIQTNLTSCGFGLIAQNKCFCEAIAKAVVEHIKASAEVPVTTGSSSGTYKVT